MRVIVTTLLLFMCLPAMAGNCVPADAGYRYQTVNQRAGTPQPQKTIWEWLPGDNKVLYHYPATGISETWTRTGTGRLVLERTFHAHKRGISYEPADLTALDKSQHWENIQSPFHSGLLEKLQQTHSVGRGCDTLVSYAGTLDDTRYKIDWLPRQQRAKQISMVRNNATMTITAVAVLESKTVQQRWQSLETVTFYDYSDIGDNEADPWISRLINHGFIEHAETSDNLQYPGHRH